MHTHDRGEPLLGYRLCVDVHSMEEQSNYMQIAGAACGGNVGGMSGVLQDIAKAPAKSLGLWCAWACRNG